MKQGGLVIATMNPLVTTTVVYFVLGTVLAGLCIAALFMFGLERLTGSTGIARDGLRRGSLAPVWRLPDLDGIVQGVADGRWTFLVFADHSLRSFPGVAEALNALHRSERDVDVIVASKAPRGLTRTTFRALGLEVPAILVEPDFYQRHKARVMPYATVIDPAGLVRSTGLVGTPDAVVTVWRVGRLLSLESRTARQPRPAAGRP